MANSESEYTQPRFRLIEPGPRVIFRPDRGHTVDPDNLRVFTCQARCTNKDGHRWTDVLYPKDTPLYCQNCTVRSNANGTERTYYCVWEGCRKYQICETCQEYISGDCGNGAHGFADAVGAEKSWMLKNIEIPDAGGEPAAYVKLVEASILPQGHEQGYPDQITEGNE